MSFVSSFLFYWHGLSLLLCLVPQPWPKTSWKNGWGVTSAALPRCCLGCSTRPTRFLPVLFLPGREGVSARPMLLGKTLRKSVCRAVCKFQGAALPALPSIRGIIFATVWLKVDFFKKANPPRDGCLREFTLPDVNERVDFSRPGITHIKTIDISKCMDICT